MHLYLITAGSRPAHSFIISTRLKKKKKIHVHFVCVDESNLRPRGWMEWFSEFVNHLGRKIYECVFSETLRTGAIYFLQ